MKHDLNLERLLIILQETLVAFGKQCSEMFKVNRTCSLNVRLKTQEIYMTPSLETSTHNLLQLMMTTTEIVCISKRNLMFRSLLAQ